MFPRIPSDRCSFVLSCSTRQASKKRRRCLRQHGRFEQLELRALLDGLSWISGPALPTALGGAAAVDTAHGVLVAGGTTNASATATPIATRLLDPFSNSWINAPNSDQGHFAGGVGATGQPGPLVTTSEGLGYKYPSDIFFFGGTNQGQVTNDVLSFDLYGTEDSINAPSLAVARYEFAYATDPTTGQLYAIGGLNSSQHAIASVERYDPVGDAWSMIAPMPQPLYAASAAPDGAGHILVFGGKNIGGQPLDTVYSYSTATDAWSSVSTMPIAASDTAALFGAYGQIYVIGGRTSGGAVSSVYIFNPVTNQWNSDAPLPSAEYGTSAVIDQNGNLDVIGGFNSAGNPVASVYQSPALPAPVGLPGVPAVVFDSDSFTYSGGPIAASATAIGSDGYTPVDGAFTYTYDGSATPPTNVGMYQLLAYFTSNDPQYVDTVTNLTVQIVPATPKVSLVGGGTITFDGSPHPIVATTAGVDGSTPVAGNFTYTYNAQSAAPINPGTYTAVANFASSDPNYADTTASTTITIPDPTIPTGVTAVGASTTSIQVSWNPVPGAAYYNVYKRVVIHDPKGSGSTIHYVVAAGNLTSTSAIVPVNYFGSLTLYVTSVSSTGVESPRSAPASAQSLYAPSLASFLLNGAVMSSASVDVGQTLQVTLLGYGNLSPTYSLVDGPANMSLDPATGLMTFTPTPKELGTFYATFTATNSTGSSTATFAFTVQPAKGDWNQDGTVNSTDLSQMMSALADVNSYQVAYGLSDSQLSAVADVNRDGAIDNADLQAMLYLLQHSASGGAAAAAPAMAQISSNSLADVISPASADIAPADSGFHTAPSNPQPVMALIVPVEAQNQSVEFDSPTLPVESSQPATSVDAKQIDSAFEFLTGNLQSISQDRPLTPSSTNVIKPMRTGDTLTAIDGFFDRFDSQANLPGRRFSRAHRLAELSDILADEQIVAPLGS